jgi:hypothetical protein
MTGGGWKLTQAAALLGALALSSVAVTQPQAASRVCRQLEADLAAASRGVGKPALLRKYDNAIVRQRQQISKASRQSDSAGCSFSLFGRNRNACAALDATLDRMNANLDALQVKRAQLAGGGSRRDRARILASLDANGCRDNTVAPRRAPVLETNRENGKENLLDRLLGDARSQPDTQDEPSDPDEERGIRAMINQPDGMDLPRAEFRTRCVRTCGGYFFPMSNAASLGDFERDQKNCDSSCPGTEMQVFYTRGIGDDSASMTSSVTGRRYSELPTAYLYRQPETSRPPACGCNAARNFEIIAGNPPNPEQAEADGETTPSIPVPVAKPDPGVPTTLPPPEQRKVRVVGPTFLPDPAGATDLQAPAPKAVP